MKKLALIMLFVLLLTGCGNVESSPEYQALLAENEELKIRLDELENGAQSLIIQIRNAYENEQFNVASSLALTLHDKFTGTPEDIEGQEIAGKILQSILSEQQKQEAGRQKNAILLAESERKKARDIISIISISTSTPNSAGGVDCSVKWTNYSGWTVKYARFKVQAYNAVGDAVSCEIRDRSIVTLKDTGPYEKYYGNTNGVWENIWYNSTITKAVLLEVEIEYMNDEVVTIDGKNFNYEW